MKKSSHTSLTQASKMFKMLYSRFSTQFLRRLIKLITCYRWTYRVSSTLKKRIIDCVLEWTPSLLVSSHPFVLLEASKVWRLVSNLVLRVSLSLGRGERDPGNEVDWSEGKQGDVAVNWEENYPKINQLQDHIRCSYVKRVIVCTIGNSKNNKVQRSQG